MPAWPSCWTEPPTRSAAGSAAEPDADADLADLADLRGRLAGHRTPQSVVHGDFWPGNLLIERGRVLGVIDWESARLAGTPARDLARFVTSYSLYLDRHTRPGRRVAGHRGLHAARWGAGVEYAIDGTGWYPDLARSFVMTRAGAARRVRVLLARRAPRRRRGHRRRRGS